MPPFVAFRFRVRDAFVLANRGTVVVGTIEDGAAAVGDAVSVERTAATAVVKGIDHVRDRCFTPDEPAPVALLLPGLSVGEVQQGDVLTSG